MTWPSVSADPQELQRLADAFDNAWIELNRSEELDPLARQAARERLGCLIIQLWQSEPSVDLAAQATQLFREGAG